MGGAFKNNFCIISPREFEGDKERNRQVSQQHLGRNEIPLEEPEQLFACGYQYKYQYVR